MTLTVIAIQAVLVLAVTVGLATQWAGPEQDISQREFAKHPRTWTPTWQALTVCGVGMAMLTVGPVYPLIGVWVYIGLAYGFPRYMASHDWLLHTHLLEWVSLLTLTGGAGWMIRHRKIPAVRGSWLVWLLVAFLAWMAITSLVSIARPGPWMPALKHHPVRFFSAAVLFASGAMWFDHKRDFTLLGLILGVALMVRVVSFPEMIQGSGDISALVVVAGPLLVLSAALMPSRWLSAIPLGMAGYLHYVLFLTQNRGAAVAFVAVVLALWLQSRRKLRLALVAGPFAGFGLWAFYGTPYWQRFVDVWQKGDAYGSVLGRYELWDAAWRMFCERPVFGVGPGEYYLHVAEYHARWVMYGPHNHVMALLSETGALGPILYLALFFGAIGLGWRIARRAKLQWVSCSATLVNCAIVAYLVSGIFIARQTEPIGYLLVGLIGSLASFSNKPSTDGTLDGKP